jgi:F-type H+-transporting ATPase subunit c
LNLGPIDDNPSDHSEEKERMDITGLGPIGAGFAALGVIGPGIGIGILTGLAAQAIGRNPDATPQIRAQFILGAAFAEGLGVLAIVVAILALVLK